jgi:hypothetical protein
MMEMCASNPDRLKPRKNQVYEPANGLFKGRRLYGFVKIREVPKGLFCY